MENPMHNNFRLRDFRRAFRHDQRRIQRYYTLHSRMGNKMTMEALFGTLVLFLAAVVHLLSPKATSLCGFFVLRIAFWLCFIFVAGMIILIYMQKGICESFLRNINRAWNQMLQRQSEYFENLSRVESNRYGYDIENRTAPRQAKIIEIQNEAKIFFFLNAIANDLMSTKDDSFEPRVSFNNIHFRLPANEAGLPSNQGSRRCSRLENDRRDKPLEKQVKTPAQASESRTEFSVIEGLTNNIGFDSFISLLKLFDSQSRRAMGIGVKLDELVLLKYKYDLVEKINLHLNGSRIQVNNTREFYEFIKSHWNDWFPQNDESSNNNEGGV